MEVVPVSLSDASITARNSFLLDSPSCDRHACERKEIVPNYDNKKSTAVGTSDDMQLGQSIESEGSADSSSTARAVRNSFTSKNASIGKEELLEHYRNLMEVDASQCKTETKQPLLSQEQKSRSTSRQTLRQPFSPKRDKPKGSKELNNTGADLREKSHIDRSSKVWKSGLLQIRRASSRSPRKTRDNHRDELPTDSSARKSTNLLQSNHQLSEKVKSEDETNLLKIESKNIEHMKSVPRQQVVRNFRKFNESNASAPLVKPRSFSLAKNKGESVQLNQSEETSSKENGTKKCYVRLTPHSLSGVTTEKVRWKSSASNLLVHGLVAHTQDDGSIESLASIALSQPLTPIVETTKTSSYGLTWSNTTADSTKGRIYFSVPLGSDTNVPDQEIVVGIKRGQEMIQLGYAYVPMFSREVSGLGVEIEIVPFDSKKRGMFSKRSDIFENDDKVYRLCSGAILRATLDIKYGPKCQFSIPVKKQLSVETEPSNVLVQSKSDTEKAEQISSDYRCAQSPHKTRTTEDTNPVEETTHPKDSPPEENLSKEKREDTPSLPKDSPPEENLSKEKREDTPSLDITRILSGIVSWRSEQGDEEIMHARMTPAASGLMSPEQKDWYSPTYKSKTSEHTDFKATAPNDTQGTKGDANLEKSVLDSQEFKNEKKVFHEIIPAEPPIKPTHSDYSNVHAEFETPHTNEDSLSLSTMADTKSADYISLNSGLDDARFLAQIVGMCAGGPTPSLRRQITNSVGPSHRLVPSQTSKHLYQDQDPASFINTNRQSFKVTNNADSVSTETKNASDIEPTNMTGSGLVRAAGTFDNSAISALTDNAEQNIHDEVSSVVESHVHDSFSGEVDPPVQQPFDSDLVKFAIELERARTRQTSNKVKQADDLLNQSRLQFFETSGTGLSKTNTCRQWNQTTGVKSDSVDNTGEDMPFDCRVDDNDVDETLPHTHSEDEQKLFRMLSGFSKESQHENQLLYPSRQLKEKPRPEDNMGSMGRPIWSRHPILKQEETTDSTSILTGAQFPDLPSLRGTDSGIVETQSMQNLGPSFDSNHQTTDCLGGTVESVFASLFGRTEMKAISNGESKDQVNDEDDPDDCAFQEVPSPSYNNHGETFSQDEESFTRTISECHNSQGSENYDKLVSPQLDRQDSEMSDIVLQDPPQARHTKQRQKADECPTGQYHSSSDMSPPPEEGFETLLYNIDEFGSKKSSSKKKKVRKDSKRRKIKRFTQQRNKSKSRAPLANKRLERLRPEENFGLRTVDGFNSPRIQSTADDTLVTNNNVSKVRRHVTWERPPFLETTPRSEDLSALSFEFSENGTTRRITDILESLSTSPNHHEESDNSCSSQEDDPRQRSNGKNLLFASWSRGDDEDDKEEYENIRENVIDDNDKHIRQTVKDEEYEKATQRLLQLSRKLGMTPEALLNQLDTP
jgi:hypothetical protein